MKLLYISDGNIPSMAANSMQVVKMSQALAKMASDFELVTLGDLRSMTQGYDLDLWQWYGVLSPFRVRRLPLLRRATYPFDANYRLSHFSTIATYYALLRRPDVIYTRSPKAATLAVRLGMNVIFETHALATDIEIDWRSLGSQKNFLLLVTISDYLAESYDRAGMMPEKLVVEHDAVDLERFQLQATQQELKAELGIGPEESLVVYAGHLYDNRGIEDIISAAANLPDVRFLLVGGWPEDVKRRHDELMSLGLNNVKLTGFVGNTYVPRYLLAADILIMPYSRAVATGKWMSPMKLFEYMAAQRPIIATKFPSIELVLDDRRNALIIEPDCPDQLEETIRCVLRSPAFARKLAQEAFCNVQYYTWDQRAIRIFSHIEPGALQPATYARMILSTTKDVIGWGAFQTKAAVGRK